MPRRLPNPRLVKIHHSYRLEEVAERLRVHKTTVRNWVKRGLPTIDKRRPMFIAGFELAEFLRAGRQSTRSVCGPGRFYCLRCRIPQRPAGDMVDFVLSDSSTGSGQLQALCSACGLVMHRRATQSKLGSVMPDIEIRVRTRSST